MSSKTSKEAHLNFAKNIANLIATQGKFTKAVDDLKEFKDETLQNFNIEIEAKRKEYDDLASQLNNAEIDGKIKCDQAIAKYKRDAAVKILEETQEIPIKKAEHEDLVNQVSGLKRKRDEDIAALEKDLDVRHKKAIAVITSTQELKQNAELASLRAQVEQKDKETLVHLNNIENLRSEIKAQRELTKQVADAGRQGQIHQTIGKQ